MNLLQVKIHFLPFEFLFAFSFFPCKLFYINFLRLFILNGISANILNPNLSFIYFYDKFNLKLYLLNFKISE